MKGQGWSINGRLLLGGIALIGILLGLWFLVNLRETRVGAIFAILSSATLLVLFLEKPICKYFGQPYDGADAQISSGALLFQVLLGAFLGVVVVILSSSTGLSIGLPQVQQSSVGAEAVASIIGAPIIEEPFFRFVVPFVLFVTLSAYTKSRWIGGLLALILGAGIFALYHWLAYGASLLVSGAFIGAAIFGGILLTIEYLRGGFQYSSRTLAIIVLSFIITHAIINGYLYSAPLFIAGGSP